MMELSRKEVLLLAGACGVAALGVWALWVGEVRYALIAVMGLLLCVTLLQLRTRHRVMLRKEQLDRLEEKIDAMSRRMANESEALARELGGQFEALAAEVRDTNSGG